MKYISIFILAFVLFGCNNSNLGDQYYYLPSYEANDIGYPYGGIIYKSKEKYSYEDIIIYGDVTNCVSNDLYILVEQKPNREVILKLFKDQIEFWNKDFLATGKNIPVKFPHGNISSQTINRLVISSNSQINKVADSLFVNETFYRQLFATGINYWIIQKAGDNVMGPLTKDGYLKMRKEMGIAEGFNLNTE